MREFVLYQAEIRTRSYVLTFIPTWVRNWLARRQFSRLTRLSDYQLRDIGLTRDEAVRLSRTPLSIDPAWEAERLRLINANTGVGRKS